MATRRLCMKGLCFLALVWALGTSCTAQRALQNLSPAEQTEYRRYRKVMTWGQERAYLAQPTAAARTAYLQEIGLAQRFQALDAADKDAILSGWPQRGMSADALLFLWGEPYYTAGDARRSAHWFYLGNSLALTERGNDHFSFGNRVDVYLVDGRVEGWVDYAPSNSDSHRHSLF